MASHAECGKRTWHMDAQNMGAIGYLQKPVKMGELETTFKKMERFIMWIQFKPKASTQQVLVICMLLDFCLD